jgi:DNA repair photolyase
VPVCLALANLGGRAHRSGLPRPIQNPPNPWQKAHVEWIGEAPPARLEIFEERAKSALSKNDSPDLPFRFSVNPYRGCIHACAYCYARPSHQYLGWGAGTDFDRKIVVKTNIAEVLERELSRPSWRREIVTLSGNTDCYQGLEASYQLTRSCIEALDRHETRFTIITKSALVSRDAEIIARAASRAGAEVFVSIPFADDAMARLVEPFASKPSRRMEAIERLSAAGVPVGVAVAPIIPGLTDEDIPEILERARNAGAKRAFMTLVRLSNEVLPVFAARILEAFPDRAGKIERAIRDARGGAMNRSSFGERMRGTGARWEATEQLFRIHAQRLGLSVSPTAPSLPEPTHRFSETREARPANDRGQDNIAKPKPEARGKRQLKLFDD